MRFVTIGKVWMYQWVRLNIYSLLIAAGGLVLTVAALSVVLYEMSWLWAVLFFCGAMLMFRMAWSVFAKYEDKCGLMERLKKKLAKGYDQRYFLPYMGTACYRHVVYFTLVDFGLEDQYSKICRHYRKFGIQRDKPKTTKFRIVGGRMIFSDESPDSSERADRSFN